MKYILLLTSLAFVAVPALAQQGGLPAVQALIKVLQAHNASLQQQINGLQSQINQLNSSVGDDGTAQALVGTWTGMANAIEFDRSLPPGSTLEFGQPFFNIFGGAPAGVAPSFAVPILGPCMGGGGLCQTGAMMVGVNPDMWLARSGTPDPITFTFQRQGVNLSGNVSQPGQPDAPFTGIAIGNNFFTARVRVPSNGRCAGTTGIVIFQGTGSLSGDRTRMTFTGSAMDGDCRHVVFRVGLTKS